MASLSPFAAEQASPFVSVVGFADKSSSTGKPHRRGVRRQRSLLSSALSLQRSPSALSASMASSKSSPSLQSMGSSEFSGHASLGADGWAEDMDAAYSSSPSSDCSEASSTMSQPQDIPYTTAAKARIDRAEQQGRARDEQLEMLQAVRAYMAARTTLCHQRTC